MKKFLEDLEKELRKNKVSEEEIEEIINDHSEMIEEAIKEGLSESELESKFGDPLRVAKEIAEEKTEEIELEIEEFEDEDSDRVWKFDTERGYEIDINLVSEDVNMHLSKGDKIIVAFSGANKVTDYRVDFVDNKLRIAYEKTIKFSFGFRRSGSATFDVFLPADKKLSFCKIGTVSGDISVKSLSSEDLNVKTTSGDAELNGIKTEDMKLESVSGDFSINDVFTVGCYISVVSGDIEAEDVRIKENIFLNTVSGDADFKNSECRDMDFRSVSGDFDGKNFYPKSISMKSVSGDISIENEDRNRQINIRSQKSVSGDVRIIAK